jgi:flagellar assembly protein FliH
MSLSKKSKVLKAENIVVIDPNEAPPAEFVRLECESADNQEDAATVTKISKEEQERRNQEAALAKEKKASFREGYEEGLKQGVEIQKQEASRMVQALTDVIKEMESVKQNILENAEHDIVELAVDLAEKVIHCEVLTNRDVITAVLKDAIKGIIDKEELKIRLNPIDYRYMLEIKSDFFQSVDGVKHVVFEEDESIQRGGAIIETLFGEVDARIDRQLGEMKTILIDSDKQ